MKLRFGGKQIPDKIIIVITKWSDERASVCARHLALTATCRRWPRRHEWEACADKMLRRHEGGARGVTSACADIMLLLFFWGGIFCFLGFCTVSRHFLVTGARASRSETLIGARDLYVALTSRLKLFRDHPVTCSKVSQTSALMHLFLFLICFIIYLLSTCFFINPSASFFLSSLYHHTSALAGSKIDQANGLSARTNQCLQNIRTINLLPHKQTTPVPHKHTYKPTCHRFFRFWMKLQSLRKKTVVKIEKHNSSITVPVPTSSVCLLF